MTGFETNATDKNLRAWLNAGPLIRRVGDGLTFVATVASARRGKASWVLRYRFAGREKEKTLGRYPDFSLKDARELARKDRALLQQGVDIAALKRREKLKTIDMHNVEGLAQIWYERQLDAPSYSPSRCHLASPVPPQRCGRPSEKETSMRSIQTLKTALVLGMASLSFATHAANGPDTFMNGKSSYGEPTAGSGATVARPT